MTHEVATPLRPTSPAHPFPPTVATPSPVSPGPTVKACFQIRQATQSSCITSRLRPGLQCDSMAAAPVWAGISPLLPGTRIAEPITAFTTAHQMIESLAGPTTIHPLRFLGECMFHGTTLLAARAFSFASPLTTERRGPTSDKLRQAHRLFATSKSRVISPRVIFI
jgi:hypothetical protein